MQLQFMSLNLTCASRFNIDQTDQEESQLLAFTPLLLSRQYLTMTFPSARG